MYDVYMCIDWFYPYIVDVELTNMSYHALPGTQTWLAGKSLIHDSPASLWRELASYG